MTITGASEADNGMIITERRNWSSESVRECCIRNDFYTCGDNEDYMKMLQFVEDSQVTIANLYRVAKDIYEHSDEQTIENVMFCLNKDAIDTFYTVQ